MSDFEDFSPEEHAEYQEWLDSIDLMGQIEMSAVAEFAAEVDYQHRLAVSIPRDTKQQSALEWIDRYAI
jgi:hypothetical protein